MRGKRVRFAASLVAVVILCGCARPASEGPRSPMAFAASFRPIYALAANALCGLPGHTLICLTQPRDDCPRSYQLSEWDAALLGQIDVLFLGGRGLESFESMFAYMRGGPVVVSLAADLALINQGAVNLDEDASHFEGENPWLYLSTRGAEQIVSAAALALTLLDPANAGLYEENQFDFAGRMTLLRAEMEALVAPVRAEPVALMHEGFAYFAGEWSLNVTAVIRREPGTYFGDAEFVDVADALADSGARAVLLERQAPARLCRDLERAGYAVVRIDTLTTGTARENKYAYEEAMLTNAWELAAVLSK